MSCFWRGFQILKDYKQLKKEVAKDFEDTINEFRKRHPYIKNISFQSKKFPFISYGSIYMGDKWNIEVYEEHIQFKD